MDKEQAIDEVSTAARTALEVGVPEMDLCWLLEGIIDAWKTEVYEDLERAAS